MAIGLLPHELNSKTGLEQVCLDGGAGEPAPGCFILVIVMRLRAKEPAHLTLTASLSSCPLGGTLVPAGGESQEEVCTGVLA